MEALSRFHTGERPRSTCSGRLQPGRLFAVAGKNALHRPSLRTELANSHANIRSVAVDQGVLKSNLARIQERVARAAARSGRSVEGITFVAVSKTFSAEAIRAAHELGLRHFGENRVQELDSK